MTTVSRLAVVIPACNEEDLLDRCLTAVAVAQQRACAADPNLIACTVVVLDACRDATAAVAARHREVLVVQTDARSVGIARRTGVEFALDKLGGDPGSCWIAGTDADSVPPPHWLLQHVAHARQGADLVLGTVLPDRSEMPPDVFTEWLRRHPQRDGHPYVHGANLGVRADVYLRAGGFAPVTEHEDVLLARAVRAAGAQVVSTASCPVVTSARLAGRTPGGFAGYLSALVPGRS